ncbi:hypothetical protein J2S17_003172 [Cytobacillus purgationiresistens]|uniref:Lincosamide nucleotidyltransferase-like C-terminal domain-containing protein n=1 Tax=Cytobacillus purgationiresistens TaxID=863449 RepID=A0ABU0AJ35_9BACI|nr:hypothetical protein [Cytobacillus purgationiresistens]MDQ0271284.1 hypothetical protein [Cytobacillus purgationiresistens]
MELNVLKRGEFARSLEVLSHVQKYILQLIRIKEQNVERWLNSTKNLERDISKESYLKYTATTAKLDQSELQSAYGNSLSVIQELFDQLKGLYQIEISQDLLRKFQEYLD